MWRSNAIGDKVPPLGPATGERRVIAREGNGRLEIIDGTRVLFLKGTPEEMGRQHGVLLKKEIRDLVDRILYGVGVGSSFEKGRWFFGEIESAQRRLAPFMDERYFREMDAHGLRRRPFARGSAAVQFLSGALPLQRLRAVWPGHGRRAASITDASWIICGASALSKTRW